MSDELKKLHNQWWERREILRQYFYGTEQHMTALYEMKSIEKKIIELGGELP